MGTQFELPDQTPCFFCDLIERGKTDDFIEETELTITRVNGRQFQEGQVVVLPRRHAPLLFDLTDREMEVVMQAARRVGRAIAQAFDCDGLLLYQNNGRVAGQGVPHFHLHVVPQQREHSTWGNGPAHLARLEGKPALGIRPIDLSDNQAQAMAAKIKSFM